MGTFTIQAGETEKLADTTKQDASRFRAFVENNDGSRARLKFADRRKNANTGTEILGGEQVQFQLEEGDALFAFNPTTNPVQVNVNPQGLALIDRSTVIQNASIRTDEVGLAKQSTLADIEQNTSEIELDTSDIELNTDDVENLLGNIDSQTNDVLTETRFNDTVTATDHLAADIQVDSVGLFKTSDFTESRNVRELQNETGLTSGTDSGGGSLPSNSVPDGKAVSVKAQFGNTGAVQINGDYPLLEGDSVSLQVQNTDQISYTTENGTEGVAFIVEG